MKNTAIAKVFYDVADLLELKHENPFKVRAYQKAARSIELWPEELETMVREGNELGAIPGVGEAIANKIKDLVSTGRLELYDKLLAEFPQGITGLLHIPGIGPKTAIRLASDLGLHTVEELEQALKDGRVAELPRMGEKSAERILAQIQASRRTDQRILIGEALPLVDEVLAGLRSVRGLRNLSATGSLRRSRETVSDIAIMGAADDPEAVIAAFASLPMVYQVVEKAPRKARVVASGGMQIDLRLVDNDTFGSVLQYFTGSREHNIALRDKFDPRGLSLSEYGITDTSNGVLEKFSTEEDFYRRLGLQYIPPELREAQGEIEAAASGRLPKLIDTADIKGDLHLHSNWSDGRRSIREMADAARQSGYQFIAISDHSHGLGIARGLDPERLAGQIGEIEKLNQAMDGFRVLTGIEVDIKSDGRLDLPDDVLARLDVVIASVHSAMGQSQQDMTARVIKAMENPHVDIIGHPTCRIIGVRDPVAMDMEALFRAALRTGTVLEINSTPQRLDLKDSHTFRARQLGIRLAVSTDAHDPAQLGFMRYGIGVARRAWCEAGDVLNSLGADEVLAFLRDRKGA